MGVYEALGLRPIINADAHLTRLVGSLIPEPVLMAMAEAARGYVDMFELQRQAGRRLARITRNEAAYITGGAAAGLFLATLAVMTGDDLKAIARLPAVDGVANEIVVHRAHRFPYDPAVLLAGATLVEVGNVWQTFPWELEAAITDRTAAVLYVAGEHVRRGALPLEATIEIAHAHDVPVIVDAAAQLPPPENLWRFTRDLHADLAIFSGGKDLRGPQASGLIVGRADLIEACRAHGAPHQRSGRAMKVGKEEIAGLLAAVEWYLQQDHAARVVGYEAIVQAWIAALARCPGVVARRDFPGDAGRPTPRALIDIDPALSGLTNVEVHRRLWNGDPPIAVALADPNGIVLAPDALQPGEEHIVAERLQEILQVVPRRA